MAVIENSKTHLLLSVEAATKEIKRVASKLCPLAVTKSKDQQSGV